MFMKAISVLCLFNLSNAEKETVRMTQDGPVRGQVLTSQDNSSVQYLLFTGIPYAAPPLGKLRFKEPQPARPWKKMRCALRPRDRCTQFDPYNSTNVIGSEDCLYLSVFVPKTVVSNLKKLPVMVWFYGGNWVSGTVGVTGADYVMEKPFIIVGMEYRLNVFGFFTTLDDNAKGNLGLKDQLQALKWVQNNIEYFNGDPSRVTIFGSGTGGTSVFYHMLSPLSLFSGAISQTGNPQSESAWQRNPMKYTKLLVEAFNIDSTDNEEIVEQLQAIDAETLIRTALDYSLVGYHGRCDSQPFAPIIEKHSKTSFIRESPRTLLLSGTFTKVPLILGFNSQPAEYCWRFFENGSEDINVYQNDPSLLIPQTLNIPEGSPCLNTTLRNITNRYFPDGNYTNPYEWIPYKSMEEFIVETLKTISYLKKEIPLYFYYFSYVGSRNQAVLRPRDVALFEELLYLAYPQNFPGANPNETAADRLTRKRLVQLWYNFAAERNPTPKPEELLQNVIWPTITPRQSYLNINSTLKVQSRIPHQSEMPFWRTLYNECGFPDPDPNIIPI